MDTPSRSVLVRTLIRTFHPEREDSYLSLERDFRDAWPPLEHLPIKMRVFRDVY